MYEIPFLQKRYGKSWKKLLLMIVSELPPCITLKLKIFLSSSFVGFLTSSSEQYFIYLHFILNTEVSFLLFVSIKPSPLPNSISQIVYAALQAYCLYRGVAEKNETQTFLLDYTNLPFAQSEDH